MHRDYVAGNDDYTYSGDVSWVLWLFLVTTLLVISLSLCWTPPPPTVVVERRAKPQRKVVRWGAHLGGAVDPWVSDGELTILHIAAMVLHSTSAIAGAFITLSGDPKVSVIAPLFEYTGGADFITPTPKVSFGTRILMPLVVVEAFTTAFHFIYLLALLEPEVQARIRRYVDTPSANPLRWVEYAITATLLSAFGAVAIGITNLYYFIKLLASGVALQAVGYAIELLDTLLPSPAVEEALALRAYDRGVPDALAKAVEESLAAMRARRKSLFKVCFAVGLLLFFPHIGIILYQIEASQTHSASTLFTENTVPFALWYSTFCIVSLLNYFKWRQFRDAKFTERWYILLSLSTKLAIFWLTFGTFRKIAEDGGFASRAGVNWNAVRYTAMAVPAGVVALYALYDAHAWREHGELFS
jgi:hypothetical protein